MCTPLSLSACAEELSSHPDKPFVEFMLRGIQKGFQIGEAGFSQPPSTFRYTTHKQSYSSVYHLAALVASQEREAFLVKADVKKAYRMVPVHPEDQYLLGVQWEGSG